MVPHRAGRGFRSVVRDWLRRGLDVRPDGGAVGGAGSGVDGRAYDAVVLTLSDPQALPLLDPAVAEERAAVTGRQGEPVLALAAGWQERVWDDAFDGWDSPRVESACGRGRRWVGRPSSGSARPTAAAR